MRGCTYGHRYMCAHGRVCVRVGVTAGGCNAALVMPWRGVDAVAAAWGPEIKEKEKMGAAKPSWRSQKAAPEVAVLYI